MAKRIELPEEIRKFFQKTGKKGGLTRAAKMSPEERSEQARKAVNARWAKVKVSSKKTATPKKPRRSKEGQ